MIPSKQITFSHTANLDFMTTRQSQALNRCLPTRKCELIIPKAERKRWAWPHDLKRLITYFLSLLLCVTSESRGNSTLKRILDRLAKKELLCARCVPTQPYTALHNRTQRC